MTGLHIRDCNRSDTAKYTITLRNDCGEKSATINVKILGMLLLVLFLMAYQLIKYSLVKILRELQ